MNETMLDVMIAGAKRRKDLALKDDGRMSTRHAYHKGAVDALEAYKKALRVT